MNETKIRLKLPAEVIIHIPSFTDQTLESCLKIAGEGASQLIEAKMKELIAHEIYKRNEKKIKEMIARTVPEIEVDIIRQVVSFLK